jgi:hypothetical protein
MLETEVINLENEKAQLQKQSDENTTESLNLKRYLYNLNCHWQKELGLFLQLEQDKKSKLVCSSQLRNQLCSRMPI